LLNILAGGTPPPGDRRVIPGGSNVGKHET
jgi:hypothetical protein